MCPESKLNGQIHPPLYKFGSIPKQTYGHAKTGQGRCPRHIPKSETKNILVDVYKTLTIPVRAFPVTSN